MPSDGRRVQRILALGDLGVFLLGGDRDGHDDPRGACGRSTHPHTIAPLLRVVMRRS